MTDRMGDGGAGKDPFANPWGDRPTTPYERSMNRNEWLKYLSVLHQGDQHQPPGGAALIQKYTGAAAAPANPPQHQANPNQGEHGGGGGRRSPDEGAGNKVQMIINFFRNKGLNNIAIAAILGNWRVESDFSPTASNPREGAIGFGQWENDRRTELQNFAARMGTTEDDPMAQLEFAWHELNTGYRDVLYNLQNATSAWQAADYFNHHYEISGDYSNDRNAYAHTYLHDNFNGVANQTLGTGGGGSGGGGGTGGGNPAHLTAVNYENALGTLSGLVTNIPALHQILNEAIAGGWTTDHFLQQIQQTDWWKNHDSAARSLIALQFQDPAEYRNQLRQAQRQVAQMAHSLGVQLTPDQVQALAHRSIVEGWDSQTLQNAVGARWNDQGNAPQGQAAQVYQQLQQIYGDQGLPMGDNALDNRVQQILAGRTTMDTYTEAALNAAKSMYPSLAHQLDLGMTVKDIADPYIQTQANLLELNPNTISLTDPHIKKALQGSIVQTGDKATATSTPIWQFEEQVRNDPRWQYTQNAHNDVNNILSYLGQSWGFEA